MPPTPPVSFEEAIVDLKVYAGNLFQSSFAYVSNPPAPPASPPPAPDLAQQAREQLAQKALAKQQAQMTSALKQLDQAEDLAAKQQGRVSYTAIALTAAHVCTAIDNLVNNAVTDGNTNARLLALAQVLTGLAALAPAEVWQQASDDNGNNGGA
jgi:hypothetical protein